MMCSDGKSAHKQHRICHVDANKIAFRTKYNGIPCTVIALAPPFGLHNAGSIWVVDFHAKTKVIAVNFYFLLYIDDVALRIGASSESKDILHTRLNLMIWFFYKNRYCFE